MQRMIEDIDFAIRYLPAERDHLPRDEMDGAGAQVALLPLRRHVPQVPRHRRLRTRLEMVSRTGRRRSRGIHHQQRLFVSTPRPAPATSYRDLFASENAQSVEVILARDYNSGAWASSTTANFYTHQRLVRQTGHDAQDRRQLPDGRRFAIHGQGQGWETMEFKQQCSNRDPRLAQTIRTPGYTRIGATTKLAPDLANSITGYHVVKFVTGTAQDAYNKSFNDLPIFRSAEVYLNFAEAKAELGTLTQEDINLTRSNEVARPCGHVQPRSSTTPTKTPTPTCQPQRQAIRTSADANKGVILEIRRERSIELSAWRDTAITTSSAGKRARPSTQPLLRHLHPRQGNQGVRPRRRRNARHLPQEQGRDPLDQGSRW